MSRFAPYRWRCFWKNLPFIFWWEPKYFLQRTFRGWSDDQLWSLDYTLGNIIVKYLKLFKRSERSGYPSSMTEEEFEKILDDMIEGIDYLTNHDDYEMKIMEDFGVEFTMTFGNPDDKGNFGVHINHTGDYEGYNTELKRRYKDSKEKARLFIEHFNSLWD